MLHQNQIVSAMVRSGFHWMHKNEWFNDSIMLEIQKNLQKFYKLLMWWIIISKWKNDINDRHR